MTSLQSRFPYPSQRMPVMARNMVATSQPLAAQAGLQALKQGGNAVDAALATAITLTVVEPTMNGIGSDAFCILWDGTQLHGLNASGCSPSGISADDFAGRKEMPAQGWDSVTVPGAVSGWAELSRRFGRLPFGKLFESAIHYAESGFMVTPITARLWAMSAGEFSGFDDFGVFLVDGKAPAMGDTFKLAEQARTLEKIAASDGADFYSGEIAKKIVAAARRDGARLSRNDLESHQCEWVDLVSQQYHGHELHEIPPNGQGLGALIMLGILECLDIGHGEMDSPEAVHCQIEAMKLAFADMHRYIADSRHMDIHPEALLDPGYLRARAQCIDPKRAGSPEFGVPKKSGTVYLATADEGGMMVSYIQSNYSGFGSGIVIPGTGISLQNRGAGFTLEAGHPNQVGGGKRPFHTIIPAFLTKAGTPVMSFGVMGGHMQAQGHAQVVIRVCDHGMNPQAASDAPRWQIDEDKRILLEGGFDASVRDGLKKRGHRVVDHDDEHKYSMGGAQLIMRTDGGYIGGSDHRKDGMAIGY
ncbi:MAG: gamma-glutamyltransferase family protein [Gammaproteobacteria bacterium]|nr:gamma-glutamyltransferase family protein [Gammaproteobacteria bacterium]